MRVIGVPCEEMGEAVMAIVQPAVGVTGDERWPKNSRRSPGAELGGVKTPRRFAFLDELPREPTGKLFKRLLRDRYAASG